MTETSITAVEQHPADLRLYVFTDDAPHSLRILSQHTEQLMTRGGLLSATFCVVGESHMVTLRLAGRVVLREVLACVRLSAARCLHQHACNSMTPHQFSTAQYQVALCFNTPLALPAAPRAAVSGLLSVAFPEIWGRIPVTEVRWHALPDRLRWWTLHTYPQEAGAQQVVSASQFVF